MNDYHALTEDEEYELFDAESDLEEVFEATCGPELSMLLVQYDGHWYARTTKREPGYWESSNIVRLPAGPAGMVDNLSVAVDRTVRQS